MSQRTGYIPPSGGTLEKRQASLYVRPDGSGCVVTSARGGRYAEDVNRELAAEWGVEAGFAAQGHGLMVWEPKGAVPILFEWFTFRVPRDFKAAAKAAAKAMQARVVSYLKALGRGETPNPDELGLSGYFRCMGAHALLAGAVPDPGLVELPAELHAVLPRGKA